MKRIWTIIGVRNVSTSLKWYQSLFGQPAASRRRFRPALQRTLSLVHRFEEKRHVNQNTQTDPEGYYVTISALIGD